MSNYRSIVLSILLLLPLAATAMTQCVQPQPGDMYSQVPTCKSAEVAPKSVTPPIAAILQPALEQTDELAYMQASNYRYIDYVPGQAYQYALYDDDPSDVTLINVTPIMLDGRAALKIALVGDQAQALLRSPSTFAQADNSCQIDMQNKQAICDSFSDFANKIAPMVKLLDKEYYPVVAAWGSITPDLMEVKANTSEQAYLSVRYGSSCTGTLVSSNKVLTAAHCVLDTDFNPIQVDPSAKHDMVAIGSNWQSTPHVFALDTSHLMDNVMPGYLPKMDESKDFALLTLTQPVSDIRPATISAESAGAAPLYVAGFGMTEPMNAMSLPTDPAAIQRALAALTSTQLLYGENTTMDNSVCRKNYSEANLPTGEAGFNDLICAGTNSEPAFCAGDSGGPLFTTSTEVWGNDTQFTVYGVVTGKGAQCQNETLNPNGSGEWINIPGLYAGTQALCSSDWLAANGVSCRS